MLICPIAHIEAIDIIEANKALVVWGHRMGACNRPFSSQAHGLFAHGRLVGVAVSAQLIAETCAGLTRAEAFELARLCAERADLCRVVLRLWREFVFPPIAQLHGQSWAVSYQDESLHSGDTYRFDGWVRLGRSSSGTDQRSGRKGRSKTIWGWNAQPDTRRAAIERLKAAVERGR